MVLSHRIRTNNLVGELIDCTIGRVMAPAARAEEIGDLKKENEELRQLNRLLALKVEKLERQLWSPKSERYVPDDKGQQKLFAEPELDPAPALPAAVNPSRKAQTSRIPKGPKPLDPSLPRQRRSEERRLREQGG